MKKIMIAVAGAGLLAAACQSDPYGYNRTGTSEAVRQGAIGAAIGAAAGQIIGGDTEATVAGAAIGAIAGGIRGSQQDRQNQQRYWDARAGAYYYCYDNRQQECYWENGERRY